MTRSIAEPCGDAADHHCVTVDDSDLLREAAKLTRGLNSAKPAIYWGDFLGSAALGYGTLVLAIMLAPNWAKIVSGAVAILALYRASSFMHELTHLKPSAVPGFHAGWNLLIGVPLMVPSFMYEGVHTLHHARTRYGTRDDPEYLPLALMPSRVLALFLAVAPAMPLLLFLRYALLAPLSAFSSKLRKRTVERYSALAINPAFRRKPPEGRVRHIWLPLEAAPGAWAIGLLVLVAIGLIPIPAFGIFLTVMSGVWMLNQVRTLVAHRWQNDGAPISVISQYLDSVNVPPPGFLPALWAPVGLRYHALHHLLPSLPYHALGEAHRRLTAAMPSASSYHRANYGSLLGLIASLVRSPARGR